jgi:hypothetical protein
MEVIMSFFKSLLLAILASIFLTYVFGTSFLALFDVNVIVDGEMIEPLKAITASALVTVILVVVALAIVLSVFGSIIFATMIILGCAVMVAIGVFWPVFLAALVIWLISRDKQSKHYA